MLWVNVCHAEAAHHVETARHFFAFFALLFRQLKPYCGAGGLIKYNSLIDLRTVILTKDIQR